MIDVALDRSFKERLTAIRSIEPDTLVSEQDQAGLSITDAGVSSVFEYQGITYLVREICPYEEYDEAFKKAQGYVVYELTCLALESGKTVFFEWEVDDELEVSMTLDRLSFRDLTDDEGQAVDEDDLDQIAHDKDAVKAGGQTYYYDDDWAAVYERSGRKEQVFLYEFETQDQTRFLTIEQWQGSGRDAGRIYTSMPVNPDAIRLVSRGGNSG